MVANPANLASLKEHVLVVCLWASPATIWERVRSQTHRPLLQTSDPLAKIRELLAVACFRLSAKFIAALKKSSIMKAR